MNLLGDYRFLAASSFVTAFLCFALAGLVLHANPKSRSCRLAFAFNSCVGLWAFFYASMFLAKGVLGTFASQMLSLATVGLNIFLTHLVLVETNLETKRKTFLRVNYIASVILGVLIFVPGFIIEGAPPKLDYPAYIDGGPFYFLVPMQLFFNFFVSTAHLWMGTRKFKGYKKNQLALFLVALVVGYASGTPGYFLAFDIPIKPVSTPLVALYPMILTYAIMKHRFLDIRKLVKNTLVFSLLFLFLLGIISIALFILKEWIAQWIGIPEALAQGIAIAIALLVYGPLKTGLSRLTNRLLFQHVVSPETIFASLSEDMIHILDTEKLACEATTRIAQILSLDRIGFYARSRSQNTIFELEASIGRMRKKEFHETKQLIQYLEKSRDFLINDNGKRERRTKLPFLANLKAMKKEASLELAAIGGVAAFPVIVKESLRAVLVIGRKRSDAPWREDEFQILKSFTTHLSLAFSNAEYAGEIRRFRENLSSNERDASAGALITGVHHEAGSTIHAMTLELSSLTGDLENPEVLAFPRKEIEALVLETMEGVREGVFKINSVIQHLSDLAERKPLKIEEGVNPAQIAAQVLKDGTIEDSNNRILVRLNIPGNLTITCDPDALHKILSNLIRNAEQAIVDKGEITIEGISFDGETRIIVRDTGAGISSESINRIFEPFYTTKRGKETGTPKGTGMGLFLVKQFMDGMGGHVEVASETQKGTAFTLIFPTLNRMVGKGAS